MGGHRRGLQGLRDPSVGNGYLNVRAETGLDTVVVPSMTCRVLAVHSPAVRHILGDGCATGSVAAHMVARIKYGVWGVSRASRSNEWGD